MEDAVINGHDQVKKAEEDSADIVEMTNATVERIHGYRQARDELAAENDRLRANNVGLQQSVAFWRAAAEKGADLAEKAMHRWAVWRAIALCLITFYIGRFLLWLFQ